MEVTRNASIYPEQAATVLQLALRTVYKYLRTASCPARRSAEEVAHTKEDLKDFIRKGGSLGRNLK